MLTKTSHLRRPLGFAVAAAALTGVTAMPGTALAAVDANIVDRTLVVTGDGNSRSLALRLSADQAKVEIDQGNDGVAEIGVRRIHFDRIVVKALGGDDLVLIDESRGAFTTTTPTTLDGGAGGDLLRGASGDETFAGQGGDDEVDGGGGDDSATLGAGDDRFVWAPGDGSDRANGQDGVDALEFLGSSGSERFRVFADGRRARLTRDIGAIDMDLGGVEQIELAAKAGADAVEVDDVSGTPLERVRADPGPGDAATDVIAVEGSEGVDDVEAAPFVQDLDAPAELGVSGLPAEVEVRNAEATDQLHVDLRGGDDELDAEAVPAGKVKLAVAGGAGGDTIVSSLAADVVQGGDGEDRVDPSGGDDTVDLGAGDDVAAWAPGDGSDRVEGQDGADRLAFAGSAASENVLISANGSRVTLFRDVASITMDLAGLEQIDFTARLGADDVHVGDLSGTGVTGVLADLAAGPDGPAGDGREDRVTVTGTNGDDVVTAAGDHGGAAITGLQARVALAGAEAGKDGLLVKLLGGDDTLDASALQDDVIGLDAEGGDDDDVLIGSEGSDALLGGDGDDVLIGGPGIDTLDGGAGENVLLQD